LLWVARGRRPRPVWLAWAAAPSIIDATLPWIGCPGLPNAPRLLLALAPGAVAGWFLSVALAELTA
jgi:hypothetical protein